jgi:hypothetical protein
MKKNLEINHALFHEIALIYEKINTKSKSRLEALKMVAAHTQSSFGDYLNGLLQDPDTVSLQFIDILDQIVFEIKENNLSNDRIHDYIIEDLYNRLMIYIDLFIDNNKYRLNLKKRLLTHDDTVIIKYYGMNEFIPDMLREYSEQPHLQKYIMRSLLGFNDDSLLNFYYEVVKQSSCLDIRIMALMGLRLQNGRFANWHLLAGEGENKNLIEYTSQFSLERLIDNPIPRSWQAMIFALIYIDIFNKKIREQDVPWVSELFRQIIDNTETNSMAGAFLTTIYTSIANFITFSGFSIIKAFCNDDDNLSTFIRTINFLPGEYFERLSNKFSLLGPDFREAVESIISKNDLIGNGKADSNIQSYLIWNIESSL